MHHISKITIKNYKSIIDAEFPLSVYTPLVGYNNAGKTNIMNAINWINKKTLLLESDFNDPKKPVIVEVEICGITDEVRNTLEEKHLTKIKDVIFEDKICIGRIQPAPESNTKDINFKVRSVNESISDLRDNPAGIDGSISPLLPDVLFIGAMENATEEVAKHGKTTAIGRLIAEILESLTKIYAPKVEKALEDVGKKLSANSSEKDPILTEIDAKIDSALGDFFHGVSAEIHIPTPEFSDFMKNATIKISEIHNRSVGRDASSFGHGAQRAVQIALIQCLAKIKQATVGTARTTLLLIDEPELYLHPQAIEVTRSSLKKLAGKNYQVIFNTHSANMIAKDDIANTLLIRHYLTDGTKAYPRIKESVEKAIDDRGKKLDILFELTSTTDILFSENIILAEGKTEKILLPKIYQHERKKTLAEDKIGLVALGGSGNVPYAMKVLQAMGIPVRAVVDLDFAFKMKIDDGLTEATKNDIAECKKISARLCKDGIIDTETSGLPTKRNNMSTAEAFALMAQEPDAKLYIQNLHECLLKKDIWLWKYGTIETHLGIKKNDDDRDKFIRNLENTSIEKEVEEMLDWLNPIETTE